MTLNNFKFTYVAHLIRYSIRDAVIMHKIAETCAWSDFWSPPPRKRVLFSSEFCETAKISILAGAGARRKRFQWYCQSILAACWKVRPSSRSILVGSNSIFLQSLRKCHCEMPLDVVPHGGCNGFFTPLLLTGPLGVCLGGPPLPQRARPGAVINSIVQLFSLARMNEAT